MKILSADFCTTAVSPAGWPRADRPEIAFCGRSNVGKSSMINALVGRKSLVRVSNTPGRTRALNFFDVVAEDPQGRRRTLRFCDLPGYGFAKVAKAEQAGWKKMIEAYLRGRETIARVVCIVDVEVGPTADDVALRAWLADAGLKAFVVATKIDRLAKARRVPAILRAAEALGVPLSDVVAFSATLRLGIDDVWDLIAGASDAFAAASNGAPPPGGL